MLLLNLYSIDRKQKVNIQIADGIIRSVVPADAATKNLPDKIRFLFKNAIVFPGLINSHDHLDFNLFPQLKNKTYTNYVEWGDDIHSVNAQTINNVLKVPKDLRIEWGIYKNLLNGVTTVINHGPKTNIGNGLISVWENCRVLHSVQLENKWKIKLNRPFIKKQPFVIHIGEGTDKSSKNEIDRLTRWNLFGKNLVGVHGVAMTAEQASKFKALVWCPDSNYFLLGRTAEIDKLKYKATILFGTDSTVSGDWNLWKHLRVAKQNNLVSDAELHNMVTSVPAAFWPVKNTGVIAENFYADIVVARNNYGLTGIDNFSNLNPEDILIVLHKGKIVLFDEELLEQLHEPTELTGYSKVYVNGNCKFVKGDIPGLISKIRAYYPEAIFPVSFE
ncbi:MAG TPA: amidohydrolase family protein [Bacteroidia bacterium]|nr:amidohydrolase family protein [Bacteroidia bacterium]